MLAAEQLRHRKKRKPVNQKDIFLSMKATGSDDRFALHSPRADAIPESATHRHYALQPIFTARRKALGYEALYRAGWEDQFSGDMDRASLTMIDNWLLHGYEEITGGAFTFINCTRQTLLSGLLPLLPKWAVFEVLETVDPDPEVLRACGLLKRMGYRISLDDFDDPTRMTAFLELADFIKIDFRLSNRQQRIRLATGLKPYGATLIAEKIETEEEFRTARWEGFELFQGFYFSERALLAVSKDTLTAADLEQVEAYLGQPGFAIHKCADWLLERPGVGCRLLRRANWLYSPRRPVNSAWEALKLVGKEEFRKIVNLAGATLIPELSNLSLQQTLPDVCDDDTGAGGAKTQSVDGTAKPKRCGRDGQGGNILTMGSIRARAQSMRPGRRR